MDGQEERNNMAKRVIIVLVWTVLCLSANAITNVTQCLNVELTAAQLVEFPDKDNSSPQACILGFVKGAIDGDYISFLTPLSDEIRIKEIGTSNLSLVASSMTNQFHEFVTSAGFSNHVIRAYTEVISNNTVYAKSFIQSRCGMLNKTNEVRTIIRQFGNSWRIVEWDVEE